MSCRIKVDEVSERRCCRRSSHEIGCALHRPRPVCGAVDHRSFGPLRRYMGARVPRACSASLRARAGATGQPQLQSLRSGITSRRSRMSDQVESIACWQTVAPLRAGSFPKAKTAFPAWRAASAARRARRTPGRTRPKPQFLREVVAAFMASARVHDLLSYPIR
jgi:hypothetical protein